MPHHRNRKKIFETKTKKIKLDRNEYVISYYDTQEDEKGLRNENSNSNKIIFFIHGNSFSKDIFQYQLLNSKLFINFRLIALDLPGHGQSDFAKLESVEGLLAPYSLPFYASILYEFILKFSFPSNSSYLLCGHSLGGHIVLEYLGLQQKKQARKRTNHDLQCKGSILIGTPPIRSLEEMNLAFLPNPNLTVAFKELVSLKEIKEFIDSCFFRKDILENWQLENFYNCFLKTDPRSRSLLLDSLTRGDFLNEIDIIQEGHSSHYFICGENDPFINLDFLKKNTGKNSTFIPLIHSGHIPHYESSEIFNELFFVICQKMFSLGFVDKNYPLESNIYF